MADVSIRRVRIWSGTLRLLHWAIALAVLGLVASGWLLEGVAGGPGAEEVHANLAYLLLALLVVRIHLLLFGRGPAQWRDFLPARPGAALQVLRFYISRGRSPLPAYYAHNPLWGPLYLVIYGLLLVQFMTGLFGLAGWHLTGGWVLAGLAAAHVAAAVAHDWGGTGSDVSALLNGHRIFVSNPVEVPGSGGPVEVNLQPPGRPGGPR